MSREAIPALGVFALVAALGLDDGGYAATAWGWSSFVLLALLAVLIARGVGRPGKAGVVFVAALGGLAAWTAASILWSSHVSASVLEVERTLLYVSAAAVFLLAGSGPALLAGVLGAATLLCGYGLVEVETGERLVEPLGYANGVAIMAVIGLLLSVGFAARAARIAAVAAAAPAPLLAATLYLTFGRGAWLALAVAMAVAVAVGPKRLQLAATALALAVPAGLAVLAADRLGASLSLAVVLALLCLLSASAPFLLRLADASFEPSQWMRTAFAALLIALPAIAVGAMLVKVGGPTGAYDAFKAAPAPTHGDTSSRVFSLSGRNRADYWSVAWQSYEDEPALGTGAGSFARTWLRERPVPQPVTDAHSLYLETLAELGPVGLALLAIALAAPLAIRRNRWTPVALAPYAAFLVHAAQDWDWELPAVTVAALACGAAPITGPAGPRIPKVAAVVPAALCVVVAFAFAGNYALERSIDAMDGLRWAEAQDEARRAQSLQPWSPEPWRVLGEVELAEGSLAVSREDFRRGLQKDADEFELWIGLGLASEGAAQQRAFQRAAELNPLSPELRELGFETGSGG